jgi:hypothetical protein
MAIKGIYNGSTVQSPWVSGGPSESDEEAWLDQNSTPLIIDRYDGSLIRGE